MAYSRWRAEVIDRAARDEFAELLRHFGAGLIKWQRFEDQAGIIIDRTRDLGVLRRGVSTSTAMCSGPID